jgi:hypothetical protein
MAAGGLMYTASFSNVSVTNAAQNFWEFITAATASILIHSIRITFTPTITSGVAQDVRALINIGTMTGTGTGGSATTPTTVNTRLVGIAAVTTVNRLVTTPGTGPTIIASDNVSIIVPYERIYTPDQRIPVSAGKKWYIGISAGLGSAYNASSEIYFEEI